MTPAIAGYATLLGAVVLELVPGSHGGRFLSFGWDATKLGHVWAVVFLVLAGGALAARLTKRDLPVLNAAVAALAAAQAYLLLDVALVPLLVLAGALLLGHDALRSGLAGRARDAVLARVDAIPNATATGLATCLAALAVSKLPGDPLSVLGGVVTIGSSVTSTAWTVVLVAAGVAGIVKRHDDRVAGGVTLLFAAWAIVLFNLSLVPLVWLAGAAIAVRARYAAAQRRTDGVLSLHGITYGPRRLVAYGVPLCLGTLSFTWSKVASAGYFMGGYESSYSSYYGGYVSDYSFTKYYMPGFSYSGSGLSQGPDAFSLSPLVVAALLVLLVMALWVDTDAPTWVYLVPAGIVGALGVWTLLHLGGGIGPWLFLPGLAMLGAAAASVALPTYRAMRAPAPA